MNILNQKCRQHKICKYYREDAVTCGRDEEAKDYCGKYPEIARLGLTKNHNSKINPMNFSLYN
jgi:hypothetical protein